jgi:thiosulfate dehydrogenase [quinone] large subunit
MLASFFESIKYVGHTLPVSFLRIFLGYFYLQLFWQKLDSNYVQTPKFAAELAETSQNLQLSATYRHLIETLVIPNWQIFTFLVLGLQLLIALSYLLGYLVRPTSLIAAFMSVQWVIFAPPEHEALPRLLVASHILMLWIGAGRCLGIDYYFYRRHRGIWW